MKKLTVVALACALLLAAETVADAQAGLKIVVVAGEDAINIIQQKTAVAPVVEVRDRNNLPVPGAMVTFSVGGTHGTFFGGLQSLTVTTNAAGQAAAAGFSPTAAGVVQINATAAFQGQTVAAVITQTNVLTAAEAAAATTGATSGATGGTAGTTAGSGGGSGLSGTKIALIGAGVGGAVLVATQVGGSEKEPVTPPVVCAYSLSPSSQSVTDRGGAFATTLTANCAWTASSDSAFITLGATSGSGGASISYTVAVNTGGARSGRITIAGSAGGATLTVSQDAVAVASLSASVTPNPVPFSGLPITDIATCQGSLDTWFYGFTIVESGGVAVTLNRVIDRLDGTLVNDLTRELRLAARGSTTGNYRWCSNGAATHVVESTWSGVDANGRAVSVTFPTVVLLPRSSRGSTEQGIVAPARVGGGPGSR